MRVVRGVPPCTSVWRYRLGVQDAALSRRKPGFESRYRYQNIVLTGEDDLADTAKPRLRAAGADLKRVHYIEKVKVVGKTTQTERDIALDRDMQKLRQAINQFPETKLIVIDPLSDYLGDTKMLSERKCVPCSGLSRLWPKQTWWRPSW